MIETDRPMVCWPISPNGKNYPGIFVPLLPLEIRKVASQMCYTETQNVSLLGERPLFTPHMCQVEWEQKTEIITRVTSQLSAIACSWNKKELSIKSLIKCTDSIFSIWACQAHAVHRYIHWPIFGQTIEHRVTSNIWIIFSVSRSLTSAVSSTVIYKMTIGNVINSFNFSGDPGNIFFTS